MKTPFQILQTLVEEVRNPDIANHTAAMRAVMDFEAYAKEFSYADTQSSAAPAVQKDGEGGQDEARTPRRNGSRSTKGKGWSPARKAAYEAKKSAPQV